MEVKATGAGGDHYWLRNRLSSLLAAGLVATLVLLGVGVVDSFGQSAYALFQDEEGLFKPLNALVGVGGLTAVAAFAQRITLLLQRLPKGRAAQLPMGLLAAVASAALVFLLLVGASGLAHAVAWRGLAPQLRSEPSGNPTAARAVADVRPGLLLAAQMRPEEQVTLSAENHIAVLPRPGPVALGPGLAAPSLVALAAAFGITGALSWLFGQMLAFINLSSFHALYSARLVRAYLGASNPRRWAGEGTASPAGGAGLRVSDSIAGDDLPWEDYRPWEAGGPLHLVNVTLNETVSGKSQIEYRDRKGLNFAVGPCGLSVGVRDHAVWGARDAGGGALPDEIAERDGRFISITPLNTRLQAFHALGLCRAGDGEGRPAGAERYGQPHGCERARLGRWVGISGAAFSTGLGARTSLGTSLLAGLFNVRLGYWWTSGISPDERSRRRARTAFRAVTAFEAFLSRLLPVQAHLLNELTARFHGPVLRRWYLSDGGHFENTAVYELLRRRVPFIVACDCGCDEGFEFEDIANLVRKARIDLGAEAVFLGDSDLAALGVHPQVRQVIGTMEEFRPVPGAAGEAPGPRRARKHALLARFSFAGAGVEGDGAEGGAGSSCHVLFLKPSLTGDEPADVLHYAAAHPAFPNESTADQYFDEAQWESYRRLGYHIARRLFDDRRRDGAGEAEVWLPRDLVPPGGASGE